MSTKRKEPAAIIAPRGVRPKQHSYIRPIGYQTRVGGTGYRAAEDNEADPLGVEPKRSASITLEPLAEYIPTRMLRAFVDYPYKIMPAENPNAISAYFYYPEIKGLLRRARESTAQFFKWKNEYSGTELPIVEVIARIPESWGERIIIAAVHSKHEIRLGCYEASFTVEYMGKDGLLRNRFPTEYLGHREYFWMVTSDRDLRQQLEKRINRYFNHKSRLKRALRA